MSTARYVFATCVSGWESAPDPTRCVCKCSACQVLGARRPLWALEAGTRGQRGAARGQGGIDPGGLENPMTAAVRELREETGITSARLVALVRACREPCLRRAAPATLVQSPGAARLALLHAPFRGLPVPAC